MREIDHESNDAKKILVGNKLDCEASRVIEKADALVSEHGVGLGICVWM